MENLTLLELENVYLNKAHIYLRKNPPTEYKVGKDHINSDLQTIPEKLEFPISKKIGLNIYDTIYYLEQRKELFLMNN